MLLAATVAKLGWLEEAKIIDESRPPIGHVEPCTPACVGGIGLSGKQRECIESMDQAEQQPGGLIGEQPQRWRSGRHCDQLPGPLAAEPSHADRIDHAR